MSFHCFTIPALHPGAAQDELNQFIATHRVLAVRREFVADGAASFWALCVEVAHGPGPLPAHLTASGATSAPSTGPAAPTSRSSSVDYKQVLNEADFTRFATLRELRKQRAHDAALAALAHGRSLHFRQGVWVRLPSPDRSKLVYPCPLSSKDHL